MNFIIILFSNNIIMPFSEIFWTSFYTASMAFCLGVFSYLYKSKCKQVDICCIKIVRDVEIEEKELEIVSKTNQYIETPRKF